MPIRSILIIKPSSLGDVVHTLPAVALIRRAWPEARLRWLINPEWAPLLEENPDVDEVILFPRRELGGITRIGRQIRWLRELRASSRSELVLDFQGLLRSAIAGRACRGKTLIGLSDAREGSRFFYDRVAKVEGGGAQHAVDRYLQMAALLGLEIGGPLSWPLPQGNPPAGFAPKEPFLLLHPFSRGDGKSLSVEDVEIICRTLPFPIVLAGRAKVDTGGIDRLGHVENLLNATTLGELIWLIRQARFVVSADSGPMHIAAALGKPLLSIHTWSDPVKVGPYHPEAWILKDRALFQRRHVRNFAERRRAAPDMEAVAAFIGERMREGGA